MTLQRPDAVVVGMINMIVAIATNMFDVIKIFGSSGIKLDRCADNIP